MSTVLTAAAGEIGKKVVKEAGKAAVSAAGEELGTAATGAAKNAGFVRSLLDRLSINLGTAFKNYLEIAEEEYNQIRTLATEPDLRTLTGEDGIYVEVGVSYEENREAREIPTYTVESLLNISRRILIEGSGGMGKSMLMRYLFLNTARYGEYIPVLLELRRVENQKPGEVSIPRLIYDCLKNLGVELPEDAFRQSLRNVKYLFLLDGFDEVKSSLAAEVAEKVSSFSAVHKKSAFIVTSRPANNYENAPFSKFTKMRSLPLNQNQAVEMVRKITKNWTWREDCERAEDFCTQLEGSLYRIHQSFAENPLLLSMMFLTFMRNADIPDHEAEFYQESYDALYSRHDTHDKGAFQREFQCGALGKDAFTKVFARFCFQSYLDQKYEFSQEEILNYLRDSIQKLELQVDAQAYLSDLRKIVCMIVLEGRQYRFSHRSFQEYFAAVYIVGLEDEDQKAVFELIRARGFYRLRGGRFYQVLFQLEGNRFVVNALEEPLCQLLQEAEKSGNADLYILRHMWGGIFSMPTGINTLFLVAGNYFHEITMTCAAIHLFHNLTEFPIIPTLKHTMMQNKSATWRQLSRWSTQESQELYSLVLEEFHIPELRAEMQEWLDKLDAKRALRMRWDFYKNL